MLVSQLVNHNGMISMIHGVMCVHAIKHFTKLVGLCGPVVKEDDSI